MCACMCVLLRHVTYKRVPQHKNYAFHASMLNLKEEREKGKEGKERTRERASHFIFL